MDWGKPGPADSIMDVNPNRTPFSGDPKQWLYLDHPDGVNGKIKVDKNTGAIQAIPGVNHPIRLPQDLYSVDQPHVATCSEPSRRNRGCWAWNGCPIARFKPQPCNVIIHKDGNYDSVRCFHAYTGISEAGFPTSQSMYLLRGWEIVTDRKTIPNKILEPFEDASGRKLMKEVIREIEVTELAPFYDKLVNGAEPPRQKRKYTRRKPLANRKEVAS